MELEIKYERIRALINEEKLDEAMQGIDEIIAKNTNQEMAYYLKGNIYRKKQDWQNAINNYSAAIEINPSSVAVGAKDMCIEILNFFNTDMYNH
jgi:tetratricopeptide (TPR) repeat protein